VSLLDLLARTAVKVKEQSINEIKEKKRKQSKEKVGSEVIMTASIVYNYLCNVTPKLAKRFLANHPEVDRSCTISLKEVVREYKNKMAVERCEGYKVCKQDHDKEAGNDVKVVVHNEVKSRGEGVTVTVSKSKTKLARKSEEPDVPEKRKPTSRKRSYSSSRQFTEDEDEKIMIAIKTFGDDINIVELAEQLGRQRGSIYSRIKKLKSGQRLRKVNMLFTLEEDQIIMDKVLQHRNGKMLKNLVLLLKDKIVEELFSLLKRNKNSIIMRWSNYIQPWILQNYCGTLNLDIRRMLINYLLETFGTIDNINWTLSARRFEDVGHTETSLRHVFDSSRKYIKRQLKPNKNSTEVTLKQFADCAEEYFGNNNCLKLREKDLDRQKQVIAYFDKKYAS